ncbi:MAG: hemin uptake protein HemP [Burkholderiales bacterium]|nr:hemin uptake protein HemP [Burkholderiales bacterium]MBS0413169.1 hemin uptake protein HemP [Pseudomonadota bacterium]
MTCPPAPPAAPPLHPVAARRADASTPLPSEALLQGRRTIEISHNGAVYRLQATRQGKLILTK